MVGAQGLGGGIVIQEENPFSFSTKHYRNRIDHPRFNGCSESVSSYIAIKCGGKEAKTLNLNITRLLDSVVSFAICKC